MNTKFEQPIEKIPCELQSLEMYLQKQIRECVGYIKRTQNSIDLQNEWKNSERGNIYQKEECSREIQRLTEVKNNYEYRLNHLIKECSGLQYEMDIKGVLSFLEE